jgi:anhydro-N-acetylmuramic acid kinase
METGELYVCGGGAYNSYLLNNYVGVYANTIGQYKPRMPWLAPTWVEATAFAWLAMRFVEQLSGNLPAVTGASGDRILGTITMV